MTPSFATDGASITSPEPPPAAAGGPGPEAPDRLRRPSGGAFVLLVVVLALLVHGYGQDVRVDPTTLVEGTGRLIDFVGQAVPPDLDRLDPILEALLITFEMALLGTIIGVVLSVPLGVLAARNTSPHRFVHLLTRGVITMCRTIPDLVWGLIFVVTVGLGPKAGVLAISVDVMGFCGRFFAESIEEIDPGLLESGRSTGARPVAVLGGVVVPACLPSFVATSMFALENSTRSSVVLGLVGAGGIGIELSVSMQLLRYDEAMAIILAIFVVVFGVERLSGAIRRRLI